jgi:hypothetical protein
MASPIIVADETSGPANTPTRLPITTPTADASILRAPVSGSRAGGPGGIRNHGGNDQGEWLPLATFREGEQRVQPRRIVDRRVGGSIGLLGRSRFPETPARP